MVAEEPAHHLMSQNLYLTSLYVQGDKVKFSLQFRGREMQFQEEGSKMFQVCRK